ARSQDLLRSSLAQRLIVFIHSCSPRQMAGKSPLEAATWGLLAGVQGRTEQFCRDIDDGDDPLVSHPGRPDDAQNAHHLVVELIRGGNDADVVQNPVSGLLADEYLDPLGPQTAVQQAQNVV